MPIPIIDLFAGPGGLGEGFSALRRGGNPIFQIKLSIEKDPHAHQTLELRAFFRQFSPNGAPEEYYEYLFGTLSREDLFSKFPDEAEKASQEAWHAELGGKAFPNNLVDDRITSVLGKRANWVLIGGPPCQAYSLIGRAKLIGEFGRETYEADSRHFLYREYLRIITRHQPPVFVMENVKGLLTAKRNEQPIFNKILKDLQNPPHAVIGSTTNGRDPALTYRLVSLVVRNGALLGAFEPEDFLVRCEKYGIPQARHRIIILGLRAEQNLKPTLLQSQAEVSIEDVISDLPEVRSGLSREPDSDEAWREVLREIPNSPWFLSPKITDTHRRDMRARLGALNGTLARGRELIKVTRRVPRAHREWYSPTTATLTPIREPITSPLSCRA